MLRLLIGTFLLARVVACTETAEPTPRAPTPTPAIEDPTSTCDRAYPSVCIPPPPPDLDCGEISFRNFTVLRTDPHGFDGDRDGVGCET